MRIASLDTLRQNWVHIHTVFLDMDGTLLDLHFDNYFWLEHMPKRYAEFRQISETEAKAHLMRRYNELRGKLQWYCLDHWCTELDMDIVELKHEVSDRIAVRANVESFLNYLRTEGKHIILLTNAHRASVELKFEYTSLERYFDQVITSHDIGIAKEQEGFWDKLATQVDFETKSSVFIDDNLDVLEAAHRWGMYYLLGIRQPDSQQAPKAAGEFPEVSCFSELML